MGECSHNAREDWGNMAKVLTADGRGSVKMLTKMVYPSLDLAGTLTFWWGLQDTFIHPKKPCLKTVGTSQNWCLRCYCCGLFTDYISARAHYHRVRSTIVPSVACQTTEVTYRSPTLSFLQAKPCADHHLSIYYAYTDKSEVYHIAMGEWCLPCFPFC